MDIAQRLEPLSESPALGSEASRKEEEERDVEKGAPLPAVNAKMWARWEEPASEA